MNDAVKKMLAKLNQISGRRDYTDESRMRLKISELREILNAAICEHKWSHPATGNGYQVCLKSGCIAERFKPAPKDDPIEAVWKKYKPMYNGGYHSLTDDVNAVLNIWSAICTEMERRGGK